MGRRRQDIEGTIAISKRKREIERDRKNEKARN